MLFRSIGVIPRMLVEREVANKALTDLRVVNSMHERKARMADLADAFLALPGGFGTWDELFEILTWTQLGIQSKPVALVNVERYWDPIVQQTSHAAASGFMKPVHAELLRHAPTPSAALDLLLAPVPLPTPKWSSK